MSVRIPLSQGKFALVDDADAEEMCRYKWSAVKRVRKSGAVVWYAARSMWCDGSFSFVYMHRLIAGTKGSEQVDHWDGDGLNNHRLNLRKCTPSQNSVNRKSKPGSTSCYKGVHWNTARRKWRASISKDKKYCYIGYFKSEVDAAMAYDAVAIQAHGDFAVLNFPERSAA